MSRESLQSDPLQELAVQFRQGSRAALERLYQRLAPALLAFLRARCQGALQAEDIAQETWLKAWKNREKFLEGQFKSWLFTIGRNVLIDAYRQKRMGNLPGDFLPGESVGEHSTPARLEALEECLEETPGEFVAVVREHLRGAKPEDIAARQNIKTATVYTRYDRGKKLLRECVERKMKSYE